jgi:esterase/lipase
MLGNGLKDRTDYGVDLMKTIFSGLLVSVFILINPCYGQGLANSEGVKKTTFQTDDTTILSGTWFGSGTTTIIFSHMKPDTQKDWEFFAIKLGKSGYRTFTFDFRGHGESEGKKKYSKNDADLVAAISYARREGAENIVLIGASMGAMATAKVASLDSFSAVVLMAPYFGNKKYAGPNKSDIEKISSPLLFISASGDKSAKYARQMFKLTKSSKEIKIFSGNDHGRKLLKHDHAEECENLIVSFLKRNSA